MLKAVISRSHSVGRRKNFFSVRNHGSFYPSRFLTSYFTRKRKSLFPRIVKGGFPTHVPTSQQKWVDLIADGIVYALKHPETFQIKPPQKRKKFSKKTKQAVLLAQNYSCSMCFVHLEVPEFDHIDGDRSNNSRFNCQALCPNCHARKTRKK